MEGRSSAHAGSSSSPTMATLPRRNSVSSLTPAKERQMLDRMQPFSKKNGTSTNSALRPPLMHNGNSSSSSLHNATANTKSNGVKSTTPITKSSNLASGSRPPTKPPPLPRRSVAVSQEETCFVSAAGDVLVCRSREFSQLMGNSFNQGTDASVKNSPSTNAMKCFDIECSEFPAMALEKSSLCNPWLTASNSREEKKEDDRGPNRQYVVRAASSSSGMHGDGASTYEWGVSNNNSKSNRSLNAGGNSSNPIEETTRALGQLELEVANSTSIIESPPGSPREAPLTDDEADDDNVLSMPSFDYSHFGNGGNDMLPTSPVRSRSRRQVDSAEIDVSLSLKLQRQQSGSRRRQPPRSSSSGLPSTNPSLSTVPSHPDVSTSPFFHGVPTFLNSLSQVRIKQVSAHPRGSHVLMISAEALLFSYGLNDHGQLGIGIKSPPAGNGTESHQRYVWTPTIITPLLENGGKAITCAAGESHSLVVVSTEGRRVLKSQSPRNDNRSRQDSGTDTPVMIEMNRVSSSPATMDTRTADHHGDESEHSSTASSSAAESVWHHQLYGFGRNNYMKIGLVHPQRKVVAELSPKQTLSASHHSSSEEHQDEMEDVLLPHRVALHCTVWPEKTSRDETNSAMRAPKLPAQGIFALSASSEHSAAIVRRATGDVELYTWGNAAYHALGLNLNKTSKAGSAKIVPVPTLVDKLSHSTKAEAPSPAKRLLEQNPPEFPVDVALGPYSSFVVTSRGRCLSFGLSYDGMLGHGKIMTEVREPTPIQFPNDGAGDDECAISAVSAGTGHVLAITNSGTVYSWGKNTDGRLGLGDSTVADEEDGVTDLERAIVWTPKILPPLTSFLPPSRLPPSSSARDPVRKPGENEYGPIVQVCAGLDCSIFVTACGKTLSCGKHSGRLGLGEVNADTNTPTQLFGGLSLWHRPAPMRMQRKNSASPSPARNRKMLKRGLTTG